MRIVHSERDLPLVRRGKAVRVEVDDKAVEAFEGETIAAVLIANGVRAFRYTRKGHNPRSIYCGMGVCYDCLVTVDGVHHVRACVTPVTDGMRIETRAEVTL